MTALTIQNLSPSSALMTWENLQGATSGDAGAYGPYTKKTVQALGTIGADITIQGSNDGLAWATLHDTLGEEIIFSSAGMVSIAQSPRFIRPDVGGAYATGNIVFTTNPTDGDTITVNGVEITFVDADPEADEILIGADENETIESLQAFLESSENSDISEAAYSLDTLTISITFKTIGTAGNSFTLAKSSTAINISDDTLTGGSGAPSDATVIIYAAQ